MTAPRILIGVVVLRPIVLELTIRRYEPSDAAAVWAVHERALRASPLPFVEDAPADDDLRDVAATYLEDGEFLVGAVDDVVAVGGFQPRDGETVEIRRMRVDPEHQRRGYGRRLLTALERRACDRGYATAALETHVDLTAAQALYESAGYEESGRDRHPETGDEFVSYRKRL